MAVVAISQLLILFVAVASANINAKTKYYFPLGEPVRHGIHYNEFSNGQYAHQLASGSSDDESPFDMLKDDPSDLGSNPAEDFQNWLKMKANEYYSEGVTVSGVDGFAETPLGNISQTCYEDVMTFFVDLDAFQPYAFKSKSLSLLKRYTDCKSDESQKVKFSLFISCIWFWPFIPQNMNVYSHVTHTTLTYRVIKTNLTQLWRFMFGKE